MAILPAIYHSYGIHHPITMIQNYQICKLQYYLIGEGDCILGGVENAGGIDAIYRRAVLVSQLLYARKDCGGDSHTAVYLPVEDVAAMVSNMAL